MTSMGASELLEVSSYHEFAHELAHEFETWWALTNAPRQCGCAVTAEATPPSTWLRRCAAFYPAKLKPARRLRSLPVRRVAPAMHNGDIIARAAAAATRDAQ